MVSLNKLIGNRIQQCLDKMNWSQSQLAEKLDVSRQTVNKIINGRKNITIAETKAIADILPLDLQELIKPAKEVEEKDPIIAFMGEVDSSEAKAGLQHAQQIMDLLIFHRDMKQEHENILADK
ncbi:putative transcriptional regulator [Halobacteroides halobius DSM 5150]|uniref:Putative transcriptional regulator n=1 Tax=Halobacteroides halobius (strain ATCC 35273 / DSM 5150 / MD-1) TaxID=748449 RepID=L0KDU3_HALHC|nr:helix-turn-helix transcriptional regulator [Halobacteroides halobius]AGB42248.1 putative transcriptional regulator [Halobacteroides halobius DSM 5150]